MSLLLKLLDIQKSVDAFVKDGNNQSDKYKYVSSDAVLGVIRPRMNELGLLLIPETRAARVHEGTTKSGTTRFLTELEKVFVWIDSETGERMEIPYYAQGVDLAGEKGVGKAETYAEKYLLMKLFHVPTSKDDPDSDGRTVTGEKRMRGTAAARENHDYFKAAIAQILFEFYGDDEQKRQSALLTMTAAKDRGYNGVGRVEEIPYAALPVVYDKAKRHYEKRLNREYVYCPSSALPDSSRSE